MDLGIQLSVGHLIVGFVMVLAYDLILNILPNPVSEWWTSQNQFPLRVLVFGLAIMATALAQTNPLVALTLIIGAVMAVGGWNWWQFVRRLNQGRQRQVTPSTPPSGQAPQTPTQPPETQTPQA